MLKNVISIGIGYLANERQPKFEQQFVQFASLLDDIQIDVIHKELAMQLFMMNHSKYM